MTTQGGHALRWTCPETACRATLRVEALDRDAAEQALLDVVREHLNIDHPGDDVNVHAAISWLAPAGHLVELWGGPFDGERIWCPPGDLPELIGVHRTEDGRAVPIRAAIARMLGVETYHRGEAPGDLAARAGMPRRYLYGCDR